MLWTRTATIPKAAGAQESGREAPQSRKSAGHRLDFAELRQGFPAVHFFRENLSGYLVGFIDPGQVPVQAADALNAGDRIAVLPAAADEQPAGNREAFDFFQTETFTHPADGFFRPVRFSAVLHNDFPGKLQGFHAGGPGNTLRKLIHNEFSEKVLCPGAACMPRTG